MECILEHTTLQTATHVAVCSVVSARIHSIVQLYSFNCNVVPARYTCTCILALTTMKTVT